MCPGLHLNNSLVSHELPHILILAVIATLIAILSWKLYQQFGWNIYKKIGGDIEMQSKILMHALFRPTFYKILLLMNVFFFLKKERFKAILIFKMLLKIDLLF